jgi:hypothetical protein
MKSLVLLVVIAGALTAQVPDPLRPRADTAVPMSKYDSPVARRADYLATTNAALRDFQKAWDSTSFTHGTVLRADTGRVTIRQGKRCIAYWV